MGGGLAGWREQGGRLVVQEKEDRVGVGWG
ncbi:hypothetical protein OIU79_026226, partial [Salix purpurea]